MTHERQSVAVRRACPSTLDFAQPCVRRQRRELIRSIGAGDRQRRVVARVLVARRDQSQEPCAMSHHSRRRSRSLTITPARATRRISRSSRRQLCRFEMVQQQRGVDHVERIVGEVEPVSTRLHNLEVRPRRQIAHARRSTISGLTSVAVTVSGGRLPRHDAEDRAAGRRRRSRHRAGSPRRRAPARAVRCHESSPPRRLNRARSSRLPANCAGSSGPSKSSVRPALALHDWRLTSARRTKCDQIVTSYSCAAVLVCR